jgi:creatinine amidohydrolase
MVIRIGELSQESFSQVKKDVVLLPIGSLEAHGAHLPLCTDAIIAEALAGAVSDKTGWPVMPVMQYGFVYGLREFPGSIVLPEELLQAMIIDIAKEVKRYGFRFLAIINCHIPNSAPITDALFKALTQEQKPGFNFTFPGYEEAYSKYCESKLWRPGIFHAEELETSIMLYLREDLVNLEKAKRNYPTAPITFGYYPHSWKEFSEFSVIGDPTLANKKKGELLFNFFVQRIIDVLRDVLKNKKFGR